MNTLNKASRIWVAVSLGLLIYLIQSSILLVNETDLVVIKQFGRPVRSIADAGLAFKLPDPIQTTVTIDKRLNVLELDSSELVTRDRRNLVVSSVVIWRIVDPVTYLASVRNKTTAEQRLETLSYSQIGAAIGATPTSEIFTDENEHPALDSLFKEISRQTNITTYEELGIEVLSIRPVKFGFPRQNLLAIYKRMESERNRLAKQYRAEGEEEAEKIRAETELEVRKLQAQAYKDAQLIISEAEAKAARVYAEALEENAGFYQFMRSLDAYEKIFNEDSTLVLSSDLPIFDRLFNAPD